MKDARPNFPLPLSSVTSGARKPGTPAPVATPQTATRNATSYTGARTPPSPGPAPRAPGYVQVASSAPAAQRSELAATEAVRRAMVTRVARQGVSDPQVEQFRWMLEELRVQLFAQELRTPAPVSSKRLQKMWDGL